MFLAAENFPVPLTSHPQIENARLRYKMYGLLVQVSPKQTDDERRLQLQMDVLFSRDPKKKVKIRLNFAQNRCARLHSSGRFGAA